MTIRKLVTAVGAALLTTALTAPVQGAVSSGKGKQVKLKSAQALPGKVPSGKVPSGAVPAGKVAIAPIQSHPHGKTYSQWSAEWWQWGLEAPTPVNPLIDPTGANCAEGQRGHVWFLAGDLGGSGDPVERACTIPTGTALFFPIVSTFYGAFQSDPPATKTEAFCRAQVELILTATTLLTLTVDGRAVKNLFSYKERSVQFVVQLPEDNIAGLVDPDERLLDPACDAGFYVFLAPLPPGAHTLHWTAAGLSQQDITYHLTVAPGR